MEYTRVVSHLARSETPNSTWVVSCLARSDTPNITYVGNLPSPIKYNWLTHNVLLGL